MSLARKKFADFKECSVSDAELDDYWASLEPATIEGRIPRRSHRHDGL
jgi:hypothetical protein